MDVISQINQKRSFGSFFYPINNLTNNCKYSTMNIKEIVKEIFDDGVDGITFLPQGDIENLQIRGFLYDKKSKYEKNSLGNYFHIVIYKCDDIGNISQQDNFVAILTDPHVYVSHIIECGFFGIITKKTKASPKFIKNLYSKILNAS